MAEEVKVGEHTYIIGKLNARHQFDLVRRLGGNSWYFEMALTDEHQDGARWIGAILTGAMSYMSQADSDFVMDTSLSVVRRKVGNGSTAILTAPGRLQFEDIDLDAMLELSDRSLQVSLGPFFEKRRLARTASSSEGDTTTGTPEDPQSR